MTTAVCTSASTAADASSHSPTSYVPYAPQLSYSSFSSYVRARGPVLLRAARSLTADPRDAEDLLQTALAKT